MSFCGRILSSVMALGIVGTCAGFVAAESAETLSEAREAIYDGAKYFVLRELEGSVALFEDGEEEPIAVYTTPLSQINPADAALLRDGIRIRGMAEVSRLLEDLDIE